MKTTFIGIALSVLMSLPVMAQQSTQRTGTTSGQKKEVKDNRSESQKAYIAPRNRTTVRSTSGQAKKFTPKPVNTSPAAESKKRGK